MINNFDMSDHTLYFGDVLKIIIEEFNINKISRAKIAFSSLKELEDFPINIDTSTIYIFDKRQYISIDLSKYNLSGYSRIHFNTSSEVYEKFRNFDDELFFTSIMNKGDELLRTINGNGTLKTINFYSPNIIKFNDNQIDIDIRAPETMDF